MFFLHIPFFYYIKVFINKIQMSTSRPFAFNPIPPNSPISGTTQTVTNNNGVTQTSDKPFTPPANPPF
jgi:hypothetical protein